jgi:two-component system phosphate regulon sensor histidine kinase PhoR
MLRSLRWKITIPFTAVILLLLVSIGILASNYVKSIYLKDLQSRQIASARLIADNILGQGLPLDSTGNLDAQTIHWSDVINERVTIIAVDGTVIGESEEDRTKMDNHLNRPEVRAALESGIGNSTRFSHTTGYSMLYTAVAAADQAGSVKAIIRLATPLVEVESSIRQLQATIGGVLLLAAVLILLVSGWIAARISRPLTDLTSAIGQLANPAPLITRSGDGDEIHRLTDSFNGMAARLDALIKENEKEKKRLELVLEHMTDAVLIVDAPGEVLLFNRAAAFLFGSEMTQIGRTLAEVSADHQVVQLWQYCLQTHQPGQASIPLNAGKKQVLAAAIYIPDDSQGYCVLFLQDVTQQQQLEQMRRDFISNISHELRTPLAGIKAMTETLLDGALKDGKNAKRFIERIQIEADALSLMVGELLELARIESGKVPLEKTQVDPGEIARSAIQRLAIQTEQAGITMDLTVQPDLPAIQADPTRLQQVLINILHNAIKFTPAGGHVSVSITSDTNSVRISIADTGKGIPSSDLPRIFERFYKVDRSRSSAGTGLGLSIARHLVEGHGGSISVVSEVGKGSTFTIQLPIA